MSSKPAAQKPASEKPQQQAAKKPLEEDDEFEDFPAEDWSDTETDGKSGKSKNLWEESWDDDETTDDFAAQLRGAQEGVGKKRVDVIVPGGGAAAAQNK